MSSANLILLALWLVPTVGILIFCVYSYRPRRTPSRALRSTYRTHRVRERTSRTSRVPSREYALSCIDEEPARPGAHRVVLHLN